MSNMLYLSEVLMRNHDMDTFEELLEAVRKSTDQAIFFKIDVKPSYPDTPANWEDQLEGAFVGVNSVTH